VDYPNWVRWNPLGTPDFWSGGLGLTLSGPISFVNFSEKFGGALANFKITRPAGFRYCRKLYILRSVYGNPII